MMEAESGSRRALLLVVTAAFGGGALVGTLATRALAPAPFSARAAVLPRASRWLQRLAKKLRPKP